MKGLWFVLVSIALAVSGCKITGSNSDSAEPAVAEATVIPLIDPTSGRGNNFGEQVVILSNGNIVVSSPGDSSQGVDLAGAIHLYDSTDGNRIASFYGDSDIFGEGLGRITPLTNGNFFITSNHYSLGSDWRIGKAYLVNGKTGERIGPEYLGTGPQSGLGSGGVVELANQHLVLISPLDDDRHGSIRLINADTGEQIGETFRGPAAGDNVGGGGVVALATGNYVVMSPGESSGGMYGVGTVRLFDGSSAEQIGPTLAGSTESDLVGTVVVLPNGNYVVASEQEDVGGIVDAGAVRVMDGLTGEQLGNVISGSRAGSGLGFLGVVVLGDNLFTVREQDDDIHISYLISGETGEALNTLSLTNAADFIFYGYRLEQPLLNGNYVASITAEATTPYSPSGNDKWGMVYLLDGQTGSTIGSPWSGNGSEYAYWPYVFLSNGNYVLGSGEDTNEFRLIDGTSGLQIGPVQGDLGVGGRTSDRIVALTNNNYMVNDYGQEVNGLANVGSLRLVSGDTGEQLGLSLSGDDADDYFGVHFVALENGNAIVGSPLDDVAGIQDAGSLVLVNGATGQQVGTTLYGEMARGYFGGNYLFSTPASQVVAFRFSSSGTTHILVIDGTTGELVEQIDTGAGATSDELIDSYVATSATGGFLVVSIPHARDASGALESAGYVVLVRR